MSQEQMFHLFNPESGSAVGNAIINPLRAHPSDDNQKGTFFFLNNHNYSDTLNSPNYGNGIQIKLTCLIIYSKCLFQLNYVVCKAAGSGTRYVNNRAINSRSSTQIKSWYSFAQSLCCVLGMKNASLGKSQKIPNNMLVQVYFIVVFWCPSVLFYPDSKTLSNESIILLALML